VSAVVIANRPEVAEEIVRTCPGAGVKHVWMHRSLVHSGTSVSDEAVRFCEARGINVIAGACPLMFGQTADFGHKCQRWIMGLTGQLPA
jgi:predicted CoA-binding protein